MVRCLSGLMLFINVLIQAQVTAVKEEVSRIVVSFPDSTQGWQKKRNLKVLINQNAFSHWQSGGGTSNIELKTHYEHHFNYLKKNLIWDNRFFLDYGVNKLNGYGVRKTEDKLEINSIVGSKLPGHWSFSYFINIKSALTNTYLYDKDPDRDFRTGGILAPLYIASGPGFMWKRDDNFYMNVAPITGKAIYINGNVNLYDKELERFVSSEDVELFGVAPGESFRLKLGFYSSGYLSFNLTDNIDVENRISLYSNYLDTPENIDLDYVMRLNMKVNKFLTTQLMFRTRYDHDEFAGLQFQESLGVGLNLKI